MTMMEAISMLDSLYDESDPDVSELVYVGTSDHSYTICRLIFPTVTTAITQQKGSGQLTPMRGGSS